MINVASIKTQGLSRKEKLRELHLAKNQSAMMFILDR
jgi:hypothetical protein